MDKTYFYGILEVPNLTSEMGVRTTVNNLVALNSAITRYTKEFLQFVLGDNYDTLKDDEGLQEHLYNDEMKTSPVANYVFYRFYPQLSVKNTNVGTMLSKSENGENVSLSRLAQVWNEMCIMMEPVYEYLCTLELEYTIRRFYTINPLGV